MHPELSWGKFLEIFFGTDIFRNCAKGGFDSQSENDFESPNKKIVSKTLFWPGKSCAAHSGRFGHISVANSLCLCANIVPF